MRVLLVVPRYQLHRQALWKFPGQEDSYVHNANDPKLKLAFAPPYQSAA